ncbi:MAG: choice-of-anchor L domain-containing protein [Spirochaetales bacterium]|nr:choice-of-anchor L domain-containing protein [Spirochaetales bacterium]
MDSLDPLDACKAIGLNEKEIISARWILPDGSEPPVNNFHIGHALFSGFGQNIKVQEGERFLVLSTGNAQLAGQAGFIPNPGFNKNYTHPLPPGFPAQSATCPVQAFGGGCDGITLEAVLKVPRDATGFLFDFKFYTAEYPGWICTIYPDHYIVLVSPSVPGSVDTNICHTPDGPICVNNSAIRVCTNCADGTDELTGTGFESYGATAWLETIAPVREKSQITVQFTIWDNSDGVFDSVVLIDNWRWVTFQVPEALTYIKDDSCPCD